MLAMDVVDTLRRRERLVARELDEIGREADLKQRLKRIYALQGIDVPDHVIQQGVAALKEDRFTYKPPKPGLARRLALIYVRRGGWEMGRRRCCGGVARSNCQFLRFHLAHKALPDDLAAGHAQVVALANSGHAQTAQQVHDAGTAALAREDLDGARSAISRLEQLETLLRQEYVVQIVNRTGVSTGVWRVPDVNQNARNFYIIVEAVAPTGDLSVPVTSEETGKTELVNIWGLRVDDATFEGVKRDKQDDGIVSNDRFGYKKPGYLKPQYEMPTSGGAITQW